MEKLNYFQTKIEENSLLYDMAKEENNEEIFKEILLELQKLDNELEDFRIENLFSGEADGNDCFIEINTGVSGCYSLLIACRCCALCIHCLSLLVVGVYCLLFVHWLFIGCLLVVCWLFIGCSFIGLLVV